MKMSSIIMLRFQTHFKIYLDLSGIEFDTKKQ